LQTHNDHHANLVTNTTFIRQQHVDRISRRLLGFSEMRQMTRYWLSLEREIHLLVDHDPAYNVAFNVLPYLRFYLRPSRCRFTHSLYSRQNETKRDV